MAQKKKKTTSTRTRKPARRSHVPKRKRPVKRHTKRQRNTVVRNKKRSKPIREKSGRTRAKSPRKGIQKTRGVASRSSKSGRRSPKPLPKQKIARRWSGLGGLDEVSDHSGDTNGRALPGRTIRDQLASLTRIAPKRDTNGFLYAKDADRKHATKRATMFLFLRSSDETAAVHETLYVSKKRKRTPDQWASWFSRHAYRGTDPDGTPTERDGIVRGSIIPGINIKTQKQWRVARDGKLGFRTHDLRKSYDSTLPKRRRKTKPHRK